jgi:hypothetical protein
MFFLTFKTQYILDFSSASRSGILGFAKQTEIFPSKDVAALAHQGFNIPNKKSQSDIMDQIRNKIVVKFALAA